MTTWDRGTYELHKLEDGKVVVTLHGDRVAGKYALFSMRESRDWLIHRMDPPADETRVQVPIGVTPMQAASGPLPEEDGWAYEPLWRGLRAIVTNDTGRVIITDAAGANVSMQFPEVRRISRAIGHLEVILDGVIVPVDATGSARDDQVGLDRRLRIRSDSGARNAAKTAAVVFMAFDVLWVEGRPVAEQPWELRRRRLEDLRLDGPGWRTGDVGTLGDVIDHRGGTVAKRFDSPYRMGVTTESWVAVG